MSRLDTWLDAECWELTTALARQMDPPLFADEIERRVAVAREQLRQSYQGQCLALGDDLMALIDALMDTPPARLLLRFVDWYPWLQRRPWARKYRP